MQRLSVLALLDDSPAALANATAHAAAGDESWAQWVTEYERGDALILRLELSLEVADGAGTVFKAARDGFFVENHIHAPKVEQQIAELASGDLAALAVDHLAQRGQDLDRHELGTMYVHVELDPKVHRRVRDRAAAAE